MKINKAKWRRTGVAFLFMAPALVLLILFVFYPIIYSIPLAFTDYSVFKETQFIGLNNFRRLFRDHDFAVSVKNSVTFVLVVPILQVLAIALALMVNRNHRGRSVYRVLIYLPVVTSMVAVSIIWKFLLEQNGIINSLLLQWGLIQTPIKFLSSTKLSLFTLMGITIWQGLGYYMMIYLSALQSFPNELVEAATLDGASGWQIFWKVRIPVLRPQIWYCSLISIIAALGVFDVVYTVTKGTGGPNKSTYVINFYSYIQAFNKFDFGYSAAIGLVLAAITMVFSIILNVYQKKSE